MTGEPRIQLAGSCTGLDVLGRITDRPAIWRFKRRGLENVKELEIHTKGRGLEHI